MPAIDVDAPSLRRERSWRCGLSDVNVGAICVGTPVPEVLRKVFEGFGAAPLDQDVSMFSATVLLMRTVATGALPQGPLLYSDSDRDLLMAASLPKLAQSWSLRCHAASRR